jgi:hypothetical protein
VSNPTQLGRNPHETVQRGRQLYGDAFPAEATLATWRSRGEGPPFHVVGRRRILYFDADIDQWMTRNRRSSRAKAAMP